MMVICKCCDRTMLIDSDEHSQDALDTRLCDDCSDREQYEHDGQPDEMQEWHDFDPDC